MVIPNTPHSVWLNDIHSELNPTRVSRVVEPASNEEIVQAIKFAAEGGIPLASSGCRHAMGGQQFATDAIALDLRQMNKVLGFDHESGLIQVEAGIQWPELIHGYLSATTALSHPWGIAQKQTGADTFTIGGTLSANAHGRGLSMQPIIQDVESFRLVLANGKSVSCSRNENADLFSLVIGGYGLFGIIADVTLQLVPRQAVKRMVEIVEIESLDEKFQHRITDGCLYGDFQFSIDECSDRFLKRGILSCYCPTKADVLTQATREMDEHNWLQLLYLAYTNRAMAYEKYTNYYLSTDGQTYWSDTHQLGPYLPDYAKQLQKLGVSNTPSSLMITELYVPRQRLAGFMHEAAEYLRDHHVTVIYGTVRLIEKDTQSFLPWAKESYACIIFNLLVEHSDTGKEKASAAFRTLIDLATERGGSYYLTYHRLASTTQMRRCYPQFGRFLELKKHYDPNEQFQSDWYRHYRDLWPTEPT